MSPSRSTALRGGLRHEMDMIEAIEVGGEPKATGSNWLVVQTRSRSVAPLLPDRDAPFAWMLAMME